MLKSWIVLIACFLVACKSDKPQNKQLPPDNSDINEIVNVVIAQEFSQNRNAPLASELHRIEVLPPNYPDSIPRPLGSVMLSDLLNIRINRQSFFQKRDSLHLLFQNQLFKVFSIEKTWSKRLKFISQDEVLKNMESEKIVSFYSMTIPVFSSDNKRAYVEWDYNCALCGEGTILFLEKIHSQWTIIAKKTSWVS